MISFIPNLLINKKSDQGFTLIELLVALVIIGILGAIALTHIWGKIGRARETEARSIIGVLNRSQQVYFLEKGAFATTTDEIEVPVGNEQYYTITISPNAIQTAIGNNNLVQGTRNYQGGVRYHPDNGIFNTIVCRSSNLPNYDNAAVIGSGVATDTTPPLNCAAGEPLQ